MRGTEHATKAHSNCAWMFSLLEAFHQIEKLSTDPTSLMGQKSKRLKAITIIPKIIPIITVCT